MRYFWFYLILMLLLCVGCNKKQPTPIKPEPYFPPFRVTNETIAFIGLIDVTQWNLMGGWNLFLINASGGSYVPRTNGGLSNWPAWSPDRGKIIFYHKGDYNLQITHIYSMKNDGSDYRCLSPGDQYEEGSTCWSPDGKRICFSRSVYQQGVHNISNLWMMDSSGANQKQITFFNHGAGDQDWLPDGSRLLFQNTVEIGGGYITTVLATIDTLGGSYTVLTPVQPLDTGLAFIQGEWSPDGNKIAFVRYHADSFNIWVMDADGSNRHQLTTSTGNVRNFQPTWSPDGGRIAFERDQRLESSVVSDIWVMNSDGTNVKQLTITNKSQNPKWK